MSTGEIVHRGLRYELIVHRGLRYELMPVSMLWKPEFDSRIGHHVKKGSVPRVDRRLRRYYLIVRLLPNVFALACLSLSSI